MTILLCFFSALSMSQDKLQTQEPRPGSMLLASYEDGRPNQRKRKLHKKKKRKKKKQVPRASRSRPKVLTFDLGVAAGSSNGESYWEGYLGLNTHFKPWLIWRNAIFMRSADKTIYGIDTSMRGVYVAKWSGTQLTTFAGPGYRLVSQGSSAPFFELGTVFRSSFLKIGGGAKFIQVPSPPKGGSHTDTVYFLVLSGGGGL